MQQAQRRQLKQFLHRSDQDDVIMGDSAPTGTLMPRGASSCMTSSSVQGMGGSAGIIRPEHRVSWPSSDPGYVSHFQQGNPMSDDVSHTILK